MSQKQYWKGLEQLHNTAEYQQSLANEFRDELPLEDLSDSLLNTKAPRRDFLKYLGFSTAAAMLAASCEMPVRKAIPYAIKPEEVTPGVANYYASTFIDAGDWCPIIVKVRDGRPIKIEGNDASTITKGGTSARVQASVLSLYDTARLRAPLGADKTKTQLWSAIDKAIAADMSGLSGKRIVLLTATIISPTQKDIIAKFLAAHPNSSHIVWDPISHSGSLLANEASYGKRTLPGYHFDKASTIVSIGADFLGTWLSPVEFAKQYSSGRKISAKNPNMSRHYQVEAMHTNTGGCADVRATCRPSEYGAVATALYNAVATGAKPALSSPNLNDLVSKAAADLKASRGTGLVVCGSNDVAVQTVINAINDNIGANGSTINWATTSNIRQGIDADMVNLVADMKAGNVGALLLHGLNPAYEYFDSVGFTEGLKKTPLSISFSERMDETAKLCKYNTPDHHFLESWGDAEPRTGYYSLMQPGISPLFKTRAFSESLMVWSGDKSRFADTWIDYWVTKLGNRANFDQALQDGIIEPAGEMPNGGGSFGGNVGVALTAIAGVKPQAGVELVVYEKVSIGRGAHWSNNPWLQEMPDPMTKATWDNYACISPMRAKEMDGGKGQDLEVNGINEVDLNKRVLKITLNGKEVSLPAVIVPGMHNDVVAVALGFGRIASVGMAAASGMVNGKYVGGRNAYPFLRWNGQTISHDSPGVKLEKTAEKYEVAITQTHSSYEGRNIIREYTLDQFQKTPNALLDERKEEIGEKFSVLPWEKQAHGGAHGAEAGHSDMDNFEQGFRDNGTLYPNYDNEPSHGGIHWGMSIDLNACIGCGSCIIACQAENNISVVGKSKVLVAQEMHWITIDRYFSGDPDKPDTIQTVFQPMLCQHCDNAPCENVCPVSATNHSSEGLNQMAYNRCIGTKYCANNCPYKVRHFNWMDWNEADCFQDNTFEDYRRDEMNDNLTRMVLNPDVTVRSRGVMEKCSFCVQRLQDGKLEAKKLGQPVVDGAIRTACQQSCPADAIAFGNMNDAGSKMHNLRKTEQKERTFYLLEEYHTLPNVNYLSKIRNTEGLIMGHSEETDLLWKNHI